MEVCVCRACLAPGTFTNCPVSCSFLVLLFDSWSYSFTRSSGSVYAGGQVKGGGESGWQAGGTEGSGDIGVAVR